MIRPLSNSLNCEKCLLARLPGMFRLLKSSYNRRVIVTFMHLRISAGLYSTLFLIVAPPRRSDTLSDRLGKRHVKTAVYRPQANRTERVNRDLVQLIANYVNDQHDTWDQFLREFAYAIRTAVNETTVGDIERLFDEVRRNTKPKHEKWEKYYNRRKRDVQIKVNDWALIKTHPSSSATKKVVAKFKPKFEGPYRVLEVKNNNIVIWRSGKRLTVNVNQVRIYRYRKIDEMEIKTGSSYRNSSHHKLSSFDSVQRRSNESQYGKKKGSGVKRELKEKGISFKKDQSERHTGKTDKRGPLIRSPPSSWSEPSRKLKMSRKETIGCKRSRESGSGGPERKIQKGSEHRVSKRVLSSNYKTNDLPKFRKRGQTEETVMPSTSGKAEESTTAPTSKSKQDQATRIPDEDVVNNKIARKEKEERILTGPSPGGPSRRSQLQVIKSGCIVSFYILSNKWLEELLQRSKSRSGIPGAILQQDNARPHVAKIVRDFCSAQHMQLLPWPAYSPDMSPIERVWVLVDRRLAREPRPAASKYELLLRIQALWKSLPEADI
ncbi:uncharacterized protein TNCV_1417211 [Trichonephila clavipes]|nr:uncharacterized protein TNCV_1417211 [Trichonephila clavipes]